MVAREIVHVQRLRRPGRRSLLKGPIQFGLEYVNMRQGGWVLPAS